MRTVVLVFLSGVLEANSYFADAPHLVKRLVLYN
jgi:hypothetical protein